MKSPRSGRIAKSNRTKAVTIEAAANVARMTSPTSSERHAHVPLDDVRALAAAFDEVFGVAALAGADRGDVITRTQLSS